MNIARIDKTTNKVVNVEVWGSTPDSDAKYKFVALGDTENVGAGHTYGVTSESFLAPAVEPQEDITKTRIVDSNGNQITRLDFIHYDTDNDVITLVGDDFVLMDSEASGVSVSLRSLAQSDADITQRLGTYTSTAKLKEIANSSSDFAEFKAAILAL